MKKFLCIMMLGCGLLFQADASLDIKDYLAYVNEAGGGESDNFGADVDLARGMILLTRGSLSEQRHFGNIKFGFANDKKANACSKFDKSEDPTTHLLILTQPSVGSDNLNAVGTGSLEEKLSITFPIKELKADKIESSKAKFNTQVRKKEISKFFVAEVISDMFNIANSVRKAVLENHKNNVTDFKTGIDIFKDIEEVDSKTIINVTDSKEDQKEAREKVINNIKIIVEKYKGVISAASVGNEKKNDIDNLIKNFNAVISLIEERNEIANADSSKAAALDRNTEKVIKRVNGLIGIIDQKSVKNVINSLGNITAKEMHEDLQSQIDCFSAEKSPKIKFAETYFKNYCAALHDLENEVGKEIKTKQKLIKFETLFDLGKSIAGSVLQERFTDEKNVGLDISAGKRPYFPKYTNDIIAAYACSVISSKELAPLAKMIEDKGGKLDKDLLDSLAKEESVVRFVPFSANRRIPSNGKAHYKQYSFSDCVETTLRQFFATLFTVRSDDGTLKTDLNRIPDDSTLLKQFFKSYDEKIGIENLANSEDFQVRDAWGEICCGHVPDKILYKQNTDGGYETISDWGNIIKLICVIMKDYPAMLNKKLQKTGSTIDEESDTTLENGEVISGRQKAAARQIVEVLNKLKLKDFSATTPLLSSVDEAVSVLNNLLGIRTDVELVADKLSNEDINKLHLGDAMSPESNKIFGAIRVRINGQSEDTNKLIFVSQRGHAFLNPIPQKQKAPVEYEIGNLNLDYITQLYKFGEEFTVTVRQGCENLNDAKYPILDFYRRIKTDDTLGEAIIWMLLHDKKHEYKDGIHRLMRHWSVWSRSEDGMGEILNSMISALTDCSNNNEKDVLEVFNMLSEGVPEDVLIDTYADLCIILPDEHPLKKKMESELLRAFKSDPSKKISLSFAYALTKIIPSTNMFDLLDRVVFPGGVPDTRELKFIIGVTESVKDTFKWFLQKYYPNGEKFPAEIGIFFIGCNFMPMADILKQTSLTYDGEVTLSNVQSILLYGRSDHMPKIVEWILNNYYQDGKKIPVDIAAWLILGASSVPDFLQRVDFKNVQPSREEIAYFAGIFDKWYTVDFSEIRDGILQYYKNNKIKVPVSLIFSFSKKSFEDLSDFLVYGVDFENRELSPDEIKRFKKMAPRIAAELPSPRL